LIINIDAIVTTKPIIPVVIFFLAVSNAALSPPAFMMPIAPIIKTKINHRIATTVISPIVEEINLLKVETAFSFDVIFPKGPNPVNPPGGARGIDDWAIKFVIILESGD